MEDIIFATFSFLFTETDSEVGGSPKSFSYDGVNYTFIESESGEFSWSFIS